MTDYIVHCVNVIVIANLCGLILNTHLVPGHHIVHSITHELTPKCHRCLGYLYMQARVYEVQRVSNRTYTSGEHRWESNVTFSVAHVSTTVPSLALFCFSPHSSQHSSSAVAEPVDKVGRDSRFLQR